MDKQTIEIVKSFDEMLDAFDRDTGDASGYNKVADKTIKLLEIMLEQDNYIEIIDDIIAATSNKKYYMIHHNILSWLVSRRNKFKALEILKNYEWYRAADSRIKKFEKYLEEYLKENDWIVY